MNVMFSEDYIQNMFLYDLKIKPLPVDVCGTASSSLPARAHFTFNHCRTSVFHIGRDGGTISFRDMTEYFGTFLKIKELTSLVSSYREEKPMDLSIYPYWSTDLFMFDRQYKNAESYPFGVSNQKPIINKNGEATMYFAASGPALAFHLCNERTKEDTKEEKATCILG